MHLSDIDSYFNQVPAQGDVRYVEGFFAERVATDFLRELSASLEWKHEALMMFGKQVMQPRLTAWYGDAGATYRYSGINLSPNPWTPALVAIKERVEQVAEFTFNSALLNLYRDGRDSMGWHRDNEKELGINPTIASVSFGASRTFRLRHVERSYAPVSIELKSGSLLLMRGETQHFWSHSIPKSTKPLSPRLNITFRFVHGKT